MNDSLPHQIDFVLTMIDCVQAGGDRDRLVGGTSGEERDAPRLGHAIVPNGRSAGPRHQHVVHDARHHAALVQNP